MTKLLTEFIIHFICASMYINKICKWKVCCILKNAWINTVPKFILLKYLWHKIIIPSMQVNRIFYGPVIFNNRYIVFIRNIEFPDLIAVLLFKSRAMIGAHWVIHAIKPLSANQYKCISNFTKPASCYCHPLVFDLYKCIIRWPLINNGVNNFINF